MPVFANGLPLCQFSATLPLDYHSDHWSVVWIRSSNDNLIKSARVAEIQDRKGTPFDFFLWTLSTNQRAGFSALDQSEASILARSSDSVESQVTQSTATVPLECHSDHCNATRNKFKPKYATPLPLCQSSATLSLDCHLTTGVPLE